MRQDTLIRLALAHMTGLAARSRQVRLHVRRHDGAARGARSQRLFRDMHAGTQHITSSPPVVQACGRELAGLAPNASWRFVELVDDLSLMYKALVLDIGDVVTDLLWNSFDDFERRTGRSGLGRGPLDPDGDPIWRRHVRGEIDIADTRTRSRPRRGTTTGKTMLS